MTRYFINNISDSLYKLEKRKVYCRDRGPTCKWCKSGYKSKALTELRRYFTEISEGEFMLELM